MGKRKRNEETSCENWFLRRAFNVLEELTVIERREEYERILSNKSCSKAFMKKYLEMYGNSDKR